MEILPWWSTYLVLCSLTVVLHLGVPLAEGCMCLPSHPQQHFCQASYVIGGHVVKREYVRVNQDDSPGMIAGIPPEQPAPGLGLQPLSPGLQPYNPEGGLHALPYESYNPEGELHPFPDEPYPFEGEPFSEPALPPLPMPQELLPLPHPEALDPLDTPAGRDLEALPYLPGGFEPALSGPEGYKPAPHPEGLEPLPDNPEAEGLPPLPLPDEVAVPQEGSNDTNSNDTSTSMVQPSNASSSLSSAPTEATLEATTPEMKTPTNDTVVRTTPGRQEVTTTTTTTTTTTPNKVPDFDSGDVSPWDYKIVYTIKLVHVYKLGKEEAEWEVGREVQLSTPASDSQCGQTTLKQDRTYLITGHRSGRVSLCDWVQEHHRLSIRQKQGLKMVYGRQCDICHIKACPTSRHCSKPRNNKATTCLYDASHVRPGRPYSPYDCLAAHSRCTGRHGGKRCKWQKNNDYHDCIKHQLP